MATIKPPNTSTFEVSFTLDLLRDVSGNSTNVYLLLAVIAWMRQISGGTKYSGMNPLHITPGTWDKGLRSGTFTLNGTRLSSFSSIAAAAKATANWIVKSGKLADSAMILKVLRRGAVTEANASLQAQDFLTALAKSDKDEIIIDANKLALDRPTLAAEARDMIASADSTAQTFLAQLWKIWTGLLGHQVLIPQPPKTVTKTAPPIKKPAKVEGLHHIPGPDYLLPYAAVTFYDERHGPLPALAGGLYRTVTLER